jgi:LPS export ABC transporter protein LptC
MIPFASPHQDRLKIIYADSIDEGERVKLVKPVLIGTNNNNEGFKLEALDGVQISKEKLAYFNTVSGEIEQFKSNSIVKINADHCELNLGTSIVKLIDQVHLISSKDYWLSTEKANISIKTKDVWGDLPINFKSAKGKIKADSFYFANKQQTLSFKGNVITVIY